MVEYFQQEVCMASKLSIEIKGLPQVEKYVSSRKSTYAKVASVALMKAGFFIEGEVKQSIAGHRAEHSSVDTGRFLNSVETKKKGEYVVLVESTVKYANFLEYGTSRFNARSHFRNTKARNKNKAVEIVQQAINKA